MYKAKDQKGIYKAYDILYSLVTDKGKKLYHQIAKQKDNVRNELEKTVQILSSMFDKLIGANLNAKLAYATSIYGNNTSSGYNNGAVIPHTFQFSRKRKKKSGTHVVDKAAFEQRGRTSKKSRATKEKTKQINISQLKAELRNYKGKSVPKHLIDKARKLGVRPKHVKGVSF